MDCSGNRLFYSLEHNHNRACPVSLGAVGCTTVVYFACAAVLVTEPAIPCISQHRRSAVSNSCLCCASMLSIVRHIASNASTMWMWFLATLCRPVRSCCEIAFQILVASCASFTVFFLLRCVSGDGVIQMVDIVLLATHLLYPAKNHLQFPCFVVGYGGSDESQR
jgi:hypothetical protein